MRKTGLFLLMTATLILSGVFLACSNDGDSENESQKTEYTVTLYTEFGANPTTAKVESGKSLGQNMTPTKDGYDFKGWFSADGTDYTGKAITGNVTLFAYFIKTTTEGAGTATVTTTTNEVGADSYQSEKTVAVTTNENGTKVTVTTESSSKTNADGSKTETESKTTENFDGTNTTVTSEKTVTTKNADGKTTSKVETTVAADGTTTITTTDEDGNTTTETTGGSGEKLEVTLNETGYPAFEIAIPQDDDICIETLSISVYRKKNGDTGYSKILDVWQNRKDSFEKNPTYEFTDWDVAKDASYSYYYQISGEDNNGEFTKTSGKSDFVAISNGKFGELTASVSGGNVTYNEKTGVLTLDTLPTISSEFSFMLKMKNLDYGYLIRQAGKYYQTKGDTIDLFKSNKGKTLIPYWYVYYYKSDDYLREYWYPVVSEFYGTDYGLPESITVPESVGDNSSDETSDNSTAFIAIGNTITFTSETDVSEIVDKILKLTEDTTIVLKGSINAVTLKQIAAAMKTNDSPKISIDISETTGISEMKSDYFSEVTNLYSINLPETVTSISESAFDKCKGLISIQIPDSVTAIGKDAFWLCSSLESLRIPDSVESIGGTAVGYCTSLKKLTIGKGVSEWNSFLNGCSALETLEINSDVPSNVFNALENLRTVIIGDSATSIASNAFYERRKLESVVIGKSVVSIGGAAFAGCLLLDSVTISSATTSIEIGAFNYEANSYGVDFTAPEKRNVYFNGTLIEWFDLSANWLDSPLDWGTYCKGGDLYINGELLTELVLPLKSYDSFKNIPVYSLQYCTSLKKLVCAGVKMGSFYGCKSLKTVVFYGYEVPSYSFENTSVEDFAYYNTVSAISNYYSDEKILDNLQGIANYYSYEDSISAGASWSLRCGRIYAGAFPGTLKTVNLPLTVHWYGAPYDTSTLSWPDNCNTEIFFSSDGEGNKEKLRQAICISMKEGQQIK